MSCGKSGHRTNVTPLLVPHNLADSGLVKSVPLRNRGLCHRWIQTANCADIVVGDFRVWMRSSVAMAALARLVFIVVGDASDEQMRWVAARRIVAMVQDVLAFRDRAVGAFVGEAMCSNLSAFFITDDSIAIAIDSASPRPARVRWSWMVVEQEPISKRNKASGVTARFRAERMSWSTRWSKSTLRAQLRVCHGLNCITNEWCES